MSKKPQHPDDVRTQETVGFVTRHLPVNPARILDVGCGMGSLSAALQALGHTVIGIDPNAEAVEAARGKGVSAQQVGLLDFKGGVADSGTLDSGKFNTVLFSYSLHHINPLSAAMDVLPGLLAPGGRVIVEEFAFERVDNPTAAWSLHTQDVLLAAGVLPAGGHWEYSDALEGADPLSRWQDAFDRHRQAMAAARGEGAQNHGHGHDHGHGHGHDHAHSHSHGGDEDLHDGHAMHDQLAARFDVLHGEDAPGLCSFWLHEMADEHTHTAQRLLALERALIEQNAIRPLGVRWVLAPK